MCGICGVWGRGEPERVRAMMSAMRHRGPDDQGIYSDGRVSLGMARLAILDVSAAGHQPMSNQDGTVWIVYNGETYNFRELRGALEREGHRFASGSDTEVILRLYELHGDGFLSRLRGMFALAIYDRRRGPGHERLLLARDPLGIKPLLYAGDAHQCVFASEIKALLTSGRVAARVDLRALRELLAFGSAAQPATLIENVRMLPPGHRLTLEGGRARLERYCALDPSRFPETERLGYAEQVHRLRELLEDTVRAHMVSDVPVGAFLSGGIDSTVLVALMARQSSRKLRTFSVGFLEEGAAIDETDAAARSAAAIGTEHTRVLVTGRDVRTRIEDIAAALDQPSVDGVNAYFVSSAAAGRVKVAVSGTGGDELFAGYPWFNAMAHAAPRLTSPGLHRLMATVAAAPMLDRLPGRLAPRLLSRVRAAGDFLELFARQYQIFGYRGAQALLAPSWADSLGTPPRNSARSAAADELPDAATVARVSALCLRGYTQNQLLRDIDAVSMAQSLEVRVPFLDPVLADFALSLPDRAKLSEGGRSGTYRDTGAKRILIDAARDVLPADFDPGSKRGFGMPFDIWLRGPLADVLEDTLSATTVKRRGYLDAKAVGRIRTDFFRRRSSWALPWVLMMFELWCRRVLDRAAPAQQ